MKLVLILIAFSLVKVRGSYPLHADGRINVLAAIPGYYKATATDCKRSMENVTAKVFGKYKSPVSLQYVTETFDTAVLVRSAVEMLESKSEWSNAVAGPYLSANCKLIKRIVRGASQIISPAVQKELDQECNQEADKVPFAALSALFQYFNMTKAKAAVILNPSISNNYANSWRDFTSIYTVFLDYTIEFSDSFMQNVRRSQANVLIFNGFNWQHINYFVCQARKNLIDIGEMIFVVTSSDLMNPYLDFIYAPCDDMGISENLLIVGNDLIPHRQCQYAISQPLSFSFGFELDLSKSYYVARSAKFNGLFAVRIMIEIRGDDLDNFEIIPKHAEAMNIFDKLKLNEAVDNSALRLAIGYLFKIIAAISVALATFQIFLAILALVLRRATPDFARRSPNTKILCLVDCLLLELAAIAFETEDFNHHWCYTRAISSVLGLSLLHGFLLFRLLLADRRNNRGLAVRFGSRTPEQKESVDSFISLMQDLAMRDARSPTALKVFSLDINQAPSTTSEIPPIPASAPASPSASSGPYVAPKWNFNKPSTTHEQERFIVIGNTLYCIVTVIPMLLWFFDNGQPENAIFTINYAAIKSKHEIPSICWRVIHPSYWLDLIVLLLLGCIFTSCFFAYHLRRTAKSNRIHDTLHTCNAVYNQVILLFSAAVVLLVLMHHEAHLDAMKITMSCVFLLSSINATVYILIGRWFIWREALKKHAVIGKFLVRIFEHKPNAPGNSKNAATPRDQESTPHRKRANTLPSIVITTPA